LPVVLETPWEPIGGQMHRTRGEQRMMSAERRLLSVPTSMIQPRLSPAEFSQALMQLYEHRSLESLTSAAAQLGAAALGATLVALWQRSDAGDELLPAATADSGRSSWPAMPRELALPRALALFQHHRGQPVGGLSVSAILERLADPVPAAESGAAEAALASVGFAEHDGRLAGVSLVAVRSDVPIAALHALSGHTAAAMRRLHQDRADTGGECDPATGLLTRTGLEERASLELARAGRYRRPLTLLLVRPGSRDAAAMRACARVLRDQLRDLDILARYDEFHLAALLPETDAQGGRLVVNRLREPLLAACACLGFATFPDDGRDWDVLRAHAVLEFGDSARPRAPIQTTQVRQSVTPPPTVVADRFPAQHGERTSLRRLFPRL
jgi:GGDEF domain-containing protein